MRRFAALMCTVTLSSQAWAQSHFQCSFASGASPPPMRWSFVGPRVNRVALVNVWPIQFPDIPFPTEELGFIEETFLEPAPYPRSTNIRKANLRDWFWFQSNGQFDLRFRVRKTPYNTSIPFSQTAKCTPLCTTGVPVCSPTPSSFACAAGSTAGCRRGTAGLATCQTTGVVTCSAGVPAACSGTDALVTCTGGGTASCSGGIAAQPRCDSSGVQYCQATDPVCNGGLCCNNELDVNVAQPRCVVAYLTSDAIIPNAVSENRAETPRGEALPFFYFNSYADFAGYGLAAYASAYTHYSEAPDTGVNALIAHEIGHSLGLLHTHSVICTTPGLPLTPALIPAGCSYTEYGQSMMGSKDWTPNYSALDRRLLGWIPDSAVTILPQSLPGPITIRMVNEEASGGPGVQLVAWPRGNGVNAVWQWSTRNQLASKPIARGLIGSFTGDVNMASIAAPSFHDVGVSAYHGESSVYDTWSIISLSASPTVGTRVFSKAANFVVSLEGIVDGGCCGDVKFWTIAQWCAEHTDVPVCG